MLAIREILFPDGFILSLWQQPAAAEDATTGSVILKNKNI
ncbi:hypothetical protein UNH65_19425 [Chitinophaga sp. 180180018-2]|nr:hypothetical protein [Chitinophaga sp. 212800010-3]